MDKRTKIRVTLNEVQVERAEGILEALGLSLSNAITMFLTQVLLRNGLPFVVSLSAEDDQVIMDQVCETLHSVYNDGYYEMDPADGQLSLDDAPEVPWDEDAEGDSCAF